MSDEGFREIQLNGKQLIFLFMAVTVVLVVTFLFGVLTGRGVREERRRPRSPAARLRRIRARRRRRTARRRRRLPAARHPQAPAAPATEELSYAERLLRDTPAEENLKPSAASGAAAAPAPVVQEPVAEKPPAPPPPAVKERDSTAPPPAPRDSAPAPVATPHHGPPSQRQSRLQPPRLSRPIRRVQATPCRWPPIEIAGMLIRWRSS